jgi:hypothetical protein
MVAELSAAEEQELEPACRLFGSIRDHGEGGCREWALYGVQLRAPERFTPDPPVAIAGHTKVTLKWRSRRLIAARWGLAETVLRDANVLDWVAWREKEWLSRLTWRSERHERDGHDVYHLVGREKLWVAPATLLREASRLQAPSLRLSGRVWHCRESNNIHALFALHSAGDTFFDDAYQQYRCHAP